MNGCLKYSCTESLSLRSTTAGMGCTAVLEGKKFNISNLLIFFNLIKLFCD